jgi:sugar lactone lactonase YvrE
MRAGPNGGEATMLVTEAGGAPLRFTNGVDIDQVTGDVYFTNSSKTYTRAQHQMVTTSGDSTGRVMKYDPRTNQVTVLQSGVTYPNGIAISADRTHLVVALTGPCKLMKYGIRGPKANTSEPFANLPGYPDNVRPDGKGGYWVALHREKYELPFGFDSHLLAIRMGTDGEMQQEMKGPLREKQSFPSSTHFPECQKSGTRGKQSSPSVALGEEMHSGKTGTRKRKVAFDGDNRRSRLQKKLKTLPRVPSPSTRGR